MNDGGSPVVQRIPEDVWWMILNDVIDEPLLFATTYKGNDWFNDGNMSRQEFYDRYEKQRKIIGSVCRLWQTFAPYKKFHIVGLKDDTDWGQETTGKAHHVLVHSSSILSRFAPGTSVEWETLGLRFSKQLPQLVSMLSYPRLRRLGLSLSKYTLRDHLPFAETLGAFSEINWLDLYVSLDSAPNHFANTSPSITLPKLEVLW
ncbi:1947_t:CDS:1, partial [Acaulospora colombiana]